MTIREKLQSRENKAQNEDIIGKSIRRAFFRIMYGYFGGTIIGFILRRIIYG